MGRFSLEKIGWVSGQWWGRQPKSDDMMDLGEGFDFFKLFEDEFRL